MYISVLMSVYNETKKQISESIESILKQSFSDFEFIIINDNPKRDELASILSYYKHLDSRIVVLRNEENIGLAMSLNKAAQFARTDIFARMDADDISEPIRFELQYKAITEGSFDLVFSNYSIIDEESKQIVFEDNVTCYSPDEIRKLLPYNSIIHHPTVMMTRDIFYRVGGYRNFPCAQDHDLWLRIWESNGRFLMLNEKLLKYRMRPNSISGSNKYKQYLTINYIQELFIQRIKYGVDNYSLENYNSYIIKNEVDNIKKINELYKYTNKLIKAKNLKHQGHHIRSTILRIIVFLSSSIFRKSYIKKIRNKRIINVYNSKITRSVIK